MAKIDEIKEILNTLRVAMSIAFGIMVVLIGAIVKRYDTQRVDGVFWIGIALAFVLMLVIAYIVTKLAQKTKEIKDL